MPMMRANVKTFKAKIEKTYKLYVNPLDNPSLLYSKLIREIIKKNPTINIMPPHKIPVPIKINTVEREIFFRCIMLCKGRLRR
jgi:hypothetical protein